VDERLRVRGAQRLRVIGVLATKAGGTEGSDDDSIIMPLTTVREKILPLKNSKGQTVAGFVLVQAASKDKVDSAVAQVTQTLREEHAIQFKGEEDFSVATQRDLQSTVGQVTSALTIFLAAVAGISLFVGGIGIMNIMLVSVTERTREIGLRKAIGARRPIILVQFLAEAIILALFGGMIGIAFGWGMATLVTIISKGAFTALITPSSIALAVGFSICVGVVFGVYPAYRASKLSPIAALRYE
jgi:putative ABC transport system permease protein